MSSVTLTADRLFSQIVRARGNCERCGTVRDLEAAHVVSRRYLTTRYDESNGRCLCHRCHIWAHAFPHDFQTWIGHDTFSALYQRAQSLEKVDISQVLKRLRARLREVAA